MLSATLSGLGCFVQRHFRAGPMISGGAGTLYDLLFHTKERTAVKGDRYRLASCSLVHIAVAVGAAVFAVVLFFLLVPHAGPGFSAAVAFFLTTFILLATPIVRLLKKRIDALVSAGRFDYGIPLLDSGREAGSILDIDELSKFIIESVGRCLDTDDVLLFLATEDGVYKPRGWRQVRNDPLIVIRDDDILISLLKERGRAVILERDGAFSDDALEAVRSIGGMHTRIIVPLVQNGELLGFLTAGMRRRFSGYEEQDVEILSAYGNAVAIALANARYYSSVVTDPLTRLHLKRYFLLRLKEIIEGARMYSYPVGVLLLDIDGFSKINEKSGRLIGDQMLRDVAYELRRGLRDTDVLGRYGPDEFAVLLAELDKDACIQVAERLRQRIASLRPEEILITVSIGIGYMTATEANYLGDDLLKRAQQALASAKQKGGDTILTWEQSL